MALRINQNIGALIANRNLRVTDGHRSKSLERLSSGLRINRASDDAAGLGISEKLRAQIRGLGQAQRNAQDGISLIQTAEGALQEASSILIRMRELAVQAANGSITDEDRTNISNESSQLLVEIDRIAETTDFNTKELLTGSDVEAAVSEVADTEGIIEVAVATGASVGDASYDVTLSTTTAAIGTITDDDSILDGAPSVDTGGDVETGTYTIEITAYTDDTDWEWSITGAGGTVATGDQADLTEVVEGIEFTLAADPGGTSTATVEATKQTVDWSIEEDEVEVASGTDLAADDVTQVINGLEFTIASTGAGGDTAEALATAAYVDDQEFTFHIGANADQTTSISIGAMSTENLGIDVIDLTTDSGANTAIGLIDAAISTVSDERSSLGAVQNRLEHTINNLEVAAENLSSSESRIRDVDMAYEMTNYTRNQIMMQAGVAMLAQANMAPQMVLSLLQ
jgi:flagellin